MRLAIAGLLTTITVFAQQRPAGAPIYGPMSPGTPLYGAMAPSARSYGTGSAGYHGGYRPAPPPVSHPSHGRTVIVPYPVYYGGDYYPPPAYYTPPPGYGYAPDQGNANDYSDQPPVVIINQNYRPDTVNPTIRDYSDVPLPPAPVRRYDATTTPPDPNGLRDDEPTIFLIALKDHTIVATIAYWAEGDTLNYVTQDVKQYHISLSQVDRDFSKQLNDERHVEFKLPPPPK